MSTPDDHFLETVEPDSSSGSEGATRSVLPISPSPPSTPKLSSIGHYQLCQVIGQGGMGIVWEATDTKLQRQVALKILPDALNLDKHRLRRFQNESRATAQLNHPNIIPIYAVGEDSGVSYFAMHLIDGVNLRQTVKAIRRDLVSKAERSTASSTNRKSHEDQTVIELRDHKERKQTSHRSDSPFEQPLELSASDFTLRSGRQFSTLRAANSVARIGAIVADAIQHAHEVGVVHRDLKPANLMLDNNGKIWVMDFGLAHVLNSPSLTRVGDLLGTYRYMSPEQATANPAFIDHRTDIYSLGVTLSELLILRPLVGGDNREEILKKVIYDPTPRLRQLDPSVPDDLAVILEKAMAKNPLDRYATAGEMRDDFNRFLQRKSIKAKRPSLRKRLKYWLERHKTVALSIGFSMAAIFVTSLVATGFVWNAWQGERMQLVRTKKALSLSESLRLLTNAAMSMQVDPGTSLSLAVMGAEGAPGKDANRVLQAAIDNINEYASNSPRKYVSGQVVISPNGDFAITCVNDGGQKLESFPAIFHSMKDGIRQSSMDDGTMITSTAISASGKFIVAKSKTSMGAMTPSSIAIWETSTKKAVKSFGGTSQGLLHASIFHPTLDRFVLCQSNEAKLIDATSGREILTLRGHAGTVTDAEFSPDGEKVVTVSSDGSVLIWSSSDGKQIGDPIKYEQNSNKPVQANFTAKSDAVIVCDGALVTRYSIGKAKDAVAGNRILRASKIAVSRSHDHCAVFSKGEATVLSSNTLEPIAELPVRRGLNGIRFHPTLPWLLTICGNTMQLFESETGEQLGEYIGHELPISDACFSGESAIASVANDGTFKLWRVKSGLDQRSFFTHDRRSFYQTSRSEFALSSDDEWIAIPTKRSFITNIRDANGALLPGEYSGRSTYGLRDSENFLTVVGKTAIVNETSSTREVFRSSFSEVLSVDTRLVDHGKKILVRTNREGVMLVDIESRARRRLRFASDFVSLMETSEDGTMAILVSEDGTFSAFDTHSGDILWTRQHEAPIVDLDISNDLQQIALLDSARNIVIWPVVSKIPVKSIPVSDVPADQLRLLNGGASVIIWDTFQNLEVRCYKTLTDDPPSQFKVAGRIAVDVHRRLPIVAIGSDAGGHLWNPDDGSNHNLTDRHCPAICLSHDRVAMQLASKANIPPSLQVNSIASQELIFSENLNLAPWSIQADVNNGHFIVTHAGFSDDLYRFKTCEFEQTSPLHESPIVWSGFTKEPLRLITISKDGAIFVSDQQGKLLAQRKLAGTGIVRAVNSNKDNSIVLVGDEAGHLSQFIWENGTLIEKVLSSDENPLGVASIRIADNGKAAVTINVAGKGRVWDLLGGSSKEISVENILSADISGSGKHCLIVSGKPGKNNTAWLFQDLSDTPAPLAADFAIRSALFSPDEKRIGVLTTEGKFLLIRREDQSVECEIPGSYERATQMAFSPDNSYLAMSKSNYCELWSLPDGQQKLQFNHKISPFAVNAKWNPFSRDGKWIITEDDIVRKHPIHVEEFARKTVPHELSEDDRRRFRLDITADLIAH